MISKISSEKEKNSILKYDAEKFHEKINELNNLYKDTTEKLKSIKNKEDLLLKSDDSKGKSEKKIVEKKFKIWIKKLKIKETKSSQLKNL